MSIAMRVICFSRPSLVAFSSLFLLSLRLSAHAAVTTLHVSPTGNDNNSGAENAPYRTILAAINNANNGDTVLLEDGTYSGNGNRDLDLGGKNITIKSRHGADKTILDCGGVPANEQTNALPVPHRAFYVHTKETTAEISGLTISQGFQQRIGGGIFVESKSAVKLTNCTFAKNFGSAVFVRDGFVTAINCTFTENTADKGGGIFGEQSNLTINGCNFTKNKAATGGGGVMLDVGDLILTKSTFTENVISMSGGSGGGAVCVGNQKCAIIGCTFTKNVVIGEGGGGYFSSALGVEVIDCVFSENRALNGGGLTIGSGMFTFPAVITGCTITKNHALYAGGVELLGNTWLTHSTIADNAAFTKSADIPLEITTSKEDYFGRGGGIGAAGKIVLSNCVVSNNKSEADGGGLYFYAGPLTDYKILNCTVCGNQATGADAQGGGLMNGSNVTILNSVFWGNSAATSAQLGLTAINSPKTTLTYSLIQGGMSGQGNLKTDPMFVDAANGDYHLRTGSPCIGAGGAVPAMPPPKKSETPILVATRPAPLTATKDRDGKPHSTPPSIGAYEPVKAK